MASRLLSSLWALPLRSCSGRICRKRTEDAKVFRWTLIHEIFRLEDLEEMDDKESNTQVYSLIGSVKGRSFVGFVLLGTEEREM